ncbi:hypothetical protein D3C71_1813860 [compost metagenome]
MAKYPRATASGRAVNRLTTHTQATASSVSVIRVMASIKVLSCSGTASKATTTAVKPLRTKAWELV